MCAGNGEHQCLDGVNVCAVRGECIQSEQIERKQIEGERYEVSMSNPLRQQFEVLLRIMAVTFMCARRVKCEHHNVKDGSKQKNLDEGGAEHNVKDRSSKSSSKTLSEMMFEEDDNDRIVSIEMDGSARVLGPLLRLEHVQTVTNVCKSNSVGPSSRKQTL